MPPLDEVIAHYESQLHQEEEAPEEETHEEAAPEEETHEPRHQEETSVFSSQEADIDMGVFSGVLSKELKELCRSLGFSPKGNKKELVSRLLHHPKFVSLEDIVAECKKEETLEVVKEESAEPVESAEVSEE